MKQQAPGILAALLGPDLDIDTQIKWAVSLAKARKLDLLIFLRMEGDLEDRVTDVAFNGADKGKKSTIVAKVLRVLKNYPEVSLGARNDLDIDALEDSSMVNNLHVSLKIIHFDDLTSFRKMLLAEIVKSKIKIFTIARQQMFDMSDVDLVKERQLLLRYIPCELVACHGIIKDNLLSSFLLATSPDRASKAALKLGLDLCTSVGGTLTALHVNPRIGLDAEQVGERRLERFLKKSLGQEVDGVKRRVVVDENIHNGIRNVWKEDKYDLVLAGAPRTQPEASLGNKLGSRIPVIMVIPAAPFANRFKEVVEEGIQRIIPQIEREERIDLVDRLQSNAAWNFDFLALMVLSTIMAAIGLIQNSAAVVIGAMLVAPLMTPLLGLGLALVQGNPVLARMSLRSIMFGVAVSLLGGIVVGLCTSTFQEPTREMLARGGPGLLDLFVAFAAGLAAAYASSRSSLIAALPGVAIAAALVPPIATSGLALSLGEFPLAFWALMLFCINMVTIILASMISLWIVGLRNLKKTSRWTVFAGSTIITAVLVLGIYLSIQPKEYVLSREIPPNLVAAVQESLGPEYYFDSLAVAYDELGVQLNVQVVGKRPASDELATYVRSVINDHYDQSVRVRLLTRINSRADNVD